MTRVSEILMHLQQTASGPLTDAVSQLPEFYWHEDIAAAENAAIFSRDWACPGLAAEIPESGDFMTFSIADKLLFSIRDGTGRIRTFVNVCRHRMMPLLTGNGHVSRITCPYHAWTYDLTGQLVGAGHMRHSVHFDKTKICLPEIRTEIWNGWIYITLNADAKSVAAALKPLNKIVARYHMQNYVPVLKEDHVWRTNWKILTENFMEGYHLPVAHKTTVGAWIQLNKTTFPDRPHDAFTYQSFIKTTKAIFGQAHPDNSYLTGVWRQTSIMPTVFPCHMYVLAPDHLWYLSLRPRGVGEVAVRFGVAIAPEVDAMLTTERARETWINELAAFFNRVNNEDRDIVEGVYLGARSGLAVPGRLSWLEREIHDFQKYLAARLVPKPKEKSK